MVPRMARVKHSRAPLFRPEAACCGFESRHAHQEKGTERKLEMKTQKRSARKRGA